MVGADGVKTFGFAAAHPHTARGDDAQAGLFQHPGDGAGEVAPRRVRLDHGKGAFDRHWSSL
jgi:hypothetical protein